MELFNLSNKTYDVLKHLITIVLPAAGALYFALGNIWEWPNVEQAVGTVVAVETFLGLVFKISDKAYTASGGDGAITVIPDGEDGGVVNIALNSNRVGKLNQGDKVLLTVQPTPDVVPDDL